MARHHKGMSHFLSSWPSMAKVLAWQAPGKRQNTFLAPVRNAQTLCPNTRRIASQTARKGWRQRRPPSRGSLPWPTSDADVRTHTRVAPLTPTSLVAFAMNSSRKTPCLDTSRSSVSSRMRIRQAGTARTDNHWLSPPERARRVWILARNRGWRATAFAPVIDLVDPPKSSVQVGSRIRRDILTFSARHIQHFPRGGGGLCLGRSL
jgi:hypothetical protein